MTAGTPPAPDRDRRQRRRTFAGVAERYAASRPTYPSQLFDRLADYGALTPGARVLEVAPGTGQATRSLAERGWRVTAVELAPELAAVARRELAGFPDVEVVVSAFEDWHRPGPPFDAAVCATAYHWLDPDTRVARLAAALRPAGTVAVIWTHHVAGGTRAFFDEVQPLYLRFDPAARPDDRLPPEDEVPPSTVELTGSDLLTDVESHRLGVDVTYTAAAYVELLSTYSSSLVLDGPAREGLLGSIGDLITTRHGGEVTKRYLFELVLARTRPQPPPTESL